MNFRCIWHGDFYNGYKCPLLQTKLTVQSKNPGGKVYGELHEAFEKLKENILTQYKDEINHIHVIQSCAFLRARKGFLKRFIKPLAIPAINRLKPRQAVRGIVFFCMNDFCSSNDICLS